jgi:type IV pilus assembly protein PilM
LFGSGKVRTGIDLGTASVKLVRGEGSNRLERITHVGVEDWDPPGASGDVARAAGALSRLLARLNLGRGRLGRVAVAIGEEASFREVVMPALTEPELRQALPFEAKRHLFLEGMTTPILDFQILGSAPPAEDGGGAQIRVLLAAGSTPQRDFALRVLGRVGLEPEVIDIEALAALNALHASLGGEDASDQVIGLLDVGSKRAALHIGSRGGGLLSRALGAGAPPVASNGEGLAAYVETLVDRLRETLTFYRGRHREEVDRLYLAGGGALLPGLPEGLADGVGLSISLLDPLKGLLVNGAGGESLAGLGPRFVTACGLSRWWDAIDV